MKLTEDYEIKQNNARSFSLIETYVGKTKDGKKKKIQKRESFYGTLYQALQGFLVQNSQQGYMAIEQSILETMAILEQAKQQIKKEFCIYVKESK